MSKRSEAHVEGQVSQVKSRRKLTGKERKARGRDVARNIQASSVRFQFGFTFGFGIVLELERKERPPLKRQTMERKSGRGRRGDYEGDQRQEVNYEDEEEGVEKERCNHSKAKARAGDQDVGIRECRSAFAGAGRG